MKVNCVVVIEGSDTLEKKICVIADKVNGQRLTGPLAEKIFDLEKEGHKIVASQKITEKLRKFRLSEAGVSGKRS